jgi:predicted ATPase/DNA-binding CsgD family transcriptional regulator
MSDAGKVPLELSSFVGRAAELATIGEAVAPGQVLTLLGPGGCGKTRLAIRTARDQTADWPDGVAWCGLEQESDPAMLADRVAEAVEVLLPTGSDRLTALADGLRDRAVLLVLDNCEHLLGAAGALTAAVLARCPRVGVLATSRTALGIERERVWRVPPMALAEALDLFRERARVTGTGAARRVCDRLDRLPLALELAAGWAGTLSLDQIADSLRDPYLLLGGDSSTAPFRQRTLEASMRWSHDLLDDDERVLFRRLSVFEPGFDADSVAGLAGLDGRDAPPSAGLLKSLRGLIDKSLVVADTSGRVARYRMLGVIREYAAARLDDAAESAVARDRHLDLQLAYVDSLQSLLDTDKDAWRAAVGPAYPNIRAAIEWGLRAADPERGRRLAAAMAWLWHLEARGLEGLRLLRLAVERGDGERTALQARVLVALGLVADTALPSIAGYDAARQAAALAAETGDDATARLADSLTAVGRLATSLDDAYREAIASRDDARAAGDAFIADASGALAGLVHLLRDEYPLAIEHIETSIDGLLRRGDRGVGASALSWLAIARARTGELDEAAALAARAVTTAEPLHDFHRTGSTRAVLAEICYLQGRIDEARQVLAPIDQLIARAEEAPYIPGWERIHALLAITDERYDEAVAWCRRESRGQDIPLTPDTRVVLAAALRLAGDETAATETLRELADVPITAAMPRIHAAALHQRALLERTTDPDQAVDLHHEALRIQAEHHLALDCIETLESLAILAVRRGAGETAGILAGATDRARAETGAAPSALDVPDTDAIERGRALDLPEAIAYAGRSRGPRRRPDTGWASLTPTERSVVDLAAQGLSNPEIAARLFISRGTVKTHLGHVYAKLQVGNRTELARLVTEAAADH